MSVGDLVRIKIDKNLVPGALTAVKKYVKLDNECGGVLGIIIKEHLIGVATVRFNNGLIRVVNKKHLEIIK